jgi:hypothetical protein
MENLIGIAVALVLGIGIGYAVGLRSRGKVEEAQPAAKDNPNWWQVRKTLTGTQLQILQFMEAKKEVSITVLQEKFSFIPDRELYYRLEQIALMKFLVRDRKEGEVCYALDPDYAGTVEDDKTVMLAPE